MTLFFLICFFKQTDDLSGPITDPIVTIDNHEWQSRKPYNQLINHTN